MPSDRHNVVISNDESTDVICSAAVAETSLAVRSVLGQPGCLASVKRWRCSWSTGDLSRTAAAIADWGRDVTAKYTKQTWTYTKFNHTNSYRYLASRHHSHIQTHTIRGSPIFSPMKFQDFSSMTWRIKRCLCTCTAGVGKLFGVEGRMSPQGTCCGKRKGKFYVKNLITVD